MCLQIILKLFLITENMSTLEKMKAETANNTVLYLSEFLRNMPFKDKTVFTLTADIEKIVIVERR